MTELISFFAIHYFPFSVMEVRGMEIPGRIGRKIKKGLSFAKNDGIMALFINGQRWGKPSSAFSDEGIKFGKDTLWEK